MASIDSGLENLMSSRVLLAKILQDPHLGMKDYISLTTKLSEFKKKDGLKNFYSDAGDKQGFDSNKTDIGFVFQTAGSNVSLLISHPVHILDETGEVSPSAFIPFCSFGGNMSLLGRKVNGFQDPVCSAFTRKIVNNQLCYEIDLNRFRDQVDWKESL